MREFGKNLISKLKDFKEGYTGEKEIIKNIIKKEGPFIFKNLHKINLFIESAEESNLKRIGILSYNLFHFYKKLKSIEIVDDYLLTHPGLLTKY